MPSVPARIPPRNHRWYRQFFSYIYNQLNFFRIHLLVFTFTPLIFSGIFYASNGHNHIKYIDALFNCVSAMAVCGLATVDLTLLTDWQQGILFLQMCVGNPVVVSWVIVLIRRHFLAKELKIRMEMHNAKRLAHRPESKRDIIHLPWWNRLFCGLFSRRRAPPAGDSKESRDNFSNSSGRQQRLRTDMIRRMDDAPKPITPSGWVIERRMSTVEDRSAVDNKLADSRQQLPSQSPPRHSAISNIPVPESSKTRETHASPHEELFTDEGRQMRKTRASRRLSDPGGAIYDLAALPVHRSQTINLAVQGRGRSMMRNQTIEFAPTPPRVHQQVHSADKGRRRRGSSASKRRNVDPVIAEESRHILADRPSFASIHSRYTTVPAKNRGYGGFPMPHEIISTLFRRFFPRVERRLQRTLTMPATHTIISQHSAAAPGARVVPYIRFDAIVGRNSSFHMLTSEQIEELCGVEFRALNALLWIVPTYHIVVQLVAFVIIAPYISTGRWASTFNVPFVRRHIVPAWFSLFQVVSAYTNTGMSLSDQSMIPYQRAYPMILVMIFLIVAGNTGFPVFLRFTIWSISKSISKRVKLYEALTFLLDHPRRCFIYLFPSHQTWFLLTVVVSLTFTDWFFFLVLDIGNAQLSSIPLGVRFIIGLLQAAAVRAAGFATVQIASIAPAVRVLYVVMMYVSIYPIAMSVRSTNVYEEKSLGIFEEDSEVIDETFQPIGRPVTIWSRYLASHMRRQLSFDMWWLAFALFLICIIERSDLSNKANASWFNIFSVLFELVSAYGTVGLSLGVPFASYSFSGALKPLSKLIICVVMIRGRHRGLPAAIDRAVMLPDLELEDDRSLRRRLSQGTASIGTYRENRSPLHPTSTITSPIHIRSDDTEDGGVPYNDRDSDHTSSFDERQEVEEDQAIAGLQV